MTYVWCCHQFSDWLVFLVNEKRKDWFHALMSICFVHHFGTILQYTWYQHQLWSVNGYRMHSYWCISDKVWGISKSPAIFFNHCLIPFFLYSRLLNKSHGVFPTWRPVCFHCANKPPHLISPKLFRLSQVVRTSLRNLIGESQWVSQGSQIFRKSKMFSKFVSKLKWKFFSNTNIWLNCMVIIE